MGARMLSVMLLSLSIHFSMLLLALLWRKRKYQISDNFPGDGPTISKNNDSSPKPIAPGQVQVYWYWGYNIDVSCALLVLRCWQQTLTMLSLLRARVLERFPSDQAPCLPSHSLVRRWEPSCRWNIVFDFHDPFCFPWRQFFAIRRTTPTLALETLGVGSVRCGTRLRRTRRRTTGGGQGCYHDVDDFDLVAVNVFVVVDIVSVATCVNFVIYFVSFNSIGVTWVDIRVSDVFVCV